MKRKRPKETWAPGKPLPKFATAAEEERFWLSHDFDDVRLDDQEMSKLQALAKRRGVTASVVLRELVRAARVVTSGTSARK